MIQGAYNRLRLLRSPEQVKRAVKRRLGLQPEPECTTLLETEPSYGPTVWHLTYFKAGNAGDVLLPVALRDLITSQVGSIHWRGQHVHRAVTDKAVKKFNQSAGVIIGGGGLFLRDTNPNELSGWQWSCSVEMLNSIQVPIALFAVGYNRFRGQPDFEPIFSEHLRLLADKSVYIGLRNNGSLRAVQNYLPEQLHSKLVYQPCMTTLLSRLYPDLFVEPRTSEPFIALNCAFDRESLRFGDDIDGVQRQVARVIARLSKDFPIKYYAHTNSDEAFLPKLEEAGVKFSLVNLCSASPDTIIEAYRRPSLTIGMRGHAQLIPFGCQTPILSLISHDKLQWFLDDINAVDWGVEVQDPDMPERLYKTAVTILNNTCEVKRHLNREQQVLWDISIRNVAQIQKAFGL